jgi:hypothetical protein
MVPATQDRSLDESLFFSTSRINVAPRLAWSCPVAFIESTVIEMLEGIGETLSYKSLLDGMEHAFEHCRILYITSLCLSLPFRQSYEAWDLRKFEL